MPTQSAIHHFTERLRKPANAQGVSPWGFVLIPTPISEGFPRRGRLHARLTINHIPFDAMLEPDGKLGHWVRIEPALIQQARMHFGDEVQITLERPAEEPYPPVPADFAEMLESHPAALATWNATTAMAQIDWIHWAESAKQAATRGKRMAQALEMLSEGKKRVCCFDPSGYYSKSLSAPPEAIP